MKRHQIAAGIDLGFVFLGRAGGIAATLFFIPRYHDLLTPAAFGVVAIILSLQSLFLTFDLGMSTIVGTEIAAARGKAREIRRALIDWRHSEAILLILIAVSFCFALLIQNIPGVAWQLHSIDIALVAMLIAGLLLTNIAHVGLNAVNRYRFSTLLLVGGTLGRGLCALLLMTTVEANVQNFLIAQVAVVLMHVVVARVVLTHELRRDGADGGVKWDRESVARVMARSKPLILYSLAGAAAIQFDKFIVAGYFSLKVAGDYYLATTYALTPIAVLGGPVYQYFLPKVASATGGDLVLLGRRFAFITIAAITAPTVVLVVFADTWLALWLPHATSRDAIATIARILIVGTALGGTGYYPTALFIGTRREAVVTRISIIATISVLLAAVAASITGSIVAVAIVYAFYHASVSAILWYRARAPRGLLLGSYIIPLALLAAGCVAICFMLRNILPGPLAAFSAIGACSLLTLFVALPWWRRYGRASSVPVA